ncbi:MAG: hypothetical protein ABXS91_03935, partial [Sulfurimonas sp.]
MWQSPDPILGEYMDGGGNSGGVYRPINLSLFTYTHNNPENLIDPDGEDVYLLTWFSKDGETGHAGVAVDNYQGGKSDGSFTYYDLWPNNPVGNTEMQTDVKADYSKGVHIKDLQTLKGKDPTQYRSGNVGAEGRKADGIIKIPASEAKTKQAQTQAKLDISKGKKYNASYNNCSTFS